MWQSCLCSYVKRISQTWLSRTKRALPECQRSAILNECSGKCITPGHRKATDKHDSIETAAGVAACCGWWLALSSPTRCHGCHCCGDPTGRSNGCGKSHPCLVSDPLCADRAKASPSERNGKRPRSCGCCGRSQCAASSCNGKHACLREQDGIGPCHAEPSPQWDGFDSQDADVVAGSRHGSEG